MILSTYAHRSGTPKQELLLLILIGPLLGGSQQSELIGCVMQLFSWNGDMDGFVRRWDMDHSLFLLLTIGWLSK